ncbi:hypothetical protein GCM10020219_033230 [Nonomuraea dietziae]
MSLRVHDERGAWDRQRRGGRAGRHRGPPVNGHADRQQHQTFTATLVLQLVAEGKIGLDAP